MVTWWLNHGWQCLPSSHGVSQVLQCPLGIFLGPRYWSGRGPAAMFEATEILQDPTGISESYHLKWFSTPCRCPNLVLFGGCLCSFHFYSYFYSSLSFACLSDFLAPTSFCDEVHLTRKTAAEFETPGGKKGEKKTLSSFGFNGCLPSNLLTCSSWSLRSILCEQCPRLWICQMICHDSSISMGTYGYEVASFPQPQRFNSYSSIQ